MCWTVDMNGKASGPQQGLSDTDADIDRFLADSHDDIAAKLAAGRGQIARGDAAPLEPLDVLLRDARATR